jgi:hypothetical protein
LTWTGGRGDWLDGQKRTGAADECEGRSMHTLRTATLMAEQAMSLARG